MPRPFAKLLLAATVMATITSTASAQPRCVAPRVLFAVDKSSSMLGTLPGGGTKWDAAVTALAEVARTFEGRVEQGLQVFPYPDRCEPGRIEIGVGDNRATDLIRGLGGTPPSTGNFTPMAQTLDVIAGYAPMLDPDRQNHVVLITDGWQWCSPYDPSTRFTPVESVRRLRAAGLTVHVIGFGGAVDALTLNRAAVAAGTDLPGCDATLTEPSAMGHCYQQVNDLADLRTALDGIARLVTEEECDGFDNDCDGTVDEGFDVDADGYTTCGTDPTVIGTVDPTRRDCDDAAAAVHPDAAEICDTLDNDCDGVVDPGCACTDGESRACGEAIGECTTGTQVCALGMWGACEGGVSAAALDDCDGRDEDCDGAIDEDAMCGAASICVMGMCEGVEPPEPTPGPEPEPEPEPMPDPPVVPRDGAPMAGGCGCDAAGSHQNAPLGLFLGLGLCLVIARRRFFA